MGGGHDPERLLTLPEVARILRVRDSDARVWLEEQGLIIRIAGRRRIHRGRLMQVLTDSEAPVDEEAAPTPRKLRVPVPQTDAF